MLALSSCSRQGKEISRWEYPDSSIHIRVIEREEAGNFLNGAYFIFESLSPIDNKWHHIVTFRHDDQIDIPHEAIAVKNANVAYIAIGWMFAITTDSGRKWSVWNAAKDLPGWRLNYKFIQRVDLDPNGNGTMILHHIPEKPGESSKLYTRDYGRSWTASAAN